MPTYPRSARGCWCIVVADCVRRVELNWALRGLQRLPRVVDHPISFFRLAAISAPDSSARIGATKVPSGPMRYSTELWSIA